MTAFDFRFSPGQSIAYTAFPDSLLSLGFLPRVGRFSDASLFDAQVRLHATCVDPVPLAGKFTFTFGAESATMREGAHIAPQAIEDALNNVGSIRDAGLVDVQHMGPGIFDVRFRENGAQSAIAVSEASLGALSRVTQIQTGTASLPSIQRINLQVGKLATVENGSFSSIAAGSITVSTYSTGDATQPQGEEIYFGDRQPEGGAFTLSINGGTIWSDPVNAPPNGYEIQQALDNLDDAEFIVTRSNGVILVTRRYNGTNTAIQANGDGLKWPEGKTCNLDWSDCLRILERHHPMDQANFELVLETCADFTDSAEPIRELLTISMRVPVDGQKGASVGVV